MKKFMVVGLFALALLALTLTSGQAQAAGEYLFKYSNSQSDTHPRSVSMYYFKDLVEGASGGRIKVELYTSGVLGKEAEVIGCADHLLHELPTLLDFVSQGKLNLDEVTATTLAVLPGWRVASTQDVVEVPPGPPVIPRAQPQSPPSRWSRSKCVRTCFNDQGRRLAARELSEADRQISRLGGRRMWPMRQYQL